MSVEEFDVFCKEFQIEWQLGYAFRNGYSIRVERRIHRIGDKVGGFSTDVSATTLDSVIAKAAAHIRMHLGIVDGGPLALPPSTAS